MTFDPIFCLSMQTAGLAEQAITRRKAFLPNGEGLMGTCKKQAACQAGFAFEELSTV